MDTYAKGYRREKELRDKFAEAGYLVDFKQRSRYQSPDLLTQFDFVAVKCGIVRWVQVKSRKSHYYTARKAIRKWLLQNDLDISCEIWCKEDRGKWFGSEIDRQGYTRAYI